MDAEKSHIFVLYSCEVIITTRSGTEQRGWIFILKHCDCHCKYNRLFRITVDDRTTMLTRGAHRIGLDVYNPTIA
jgi:hypothetical protein